MSKRLLIWIPAIALGVLIIWRLVANHRDKTAQVDAATRRKNAPVNVRVAPAVVRDIVHVFQGAANVFAPADVRIAPKVTGLLISVQGREGDRVTKGQVLARLDPSQAQDAVSQQQAAVDSARANLANAEVRFRRYDGLYHKGFVSAQDRDDYRAQMEVQQSALRAAQAQLRNSQSQQSDLVLRSPIDGFITSRFLDPGSVVTAGQSVLGVQTMRSVYVTSSVPEGINRLVHIGMDATVESDAMPGQVFKGTITQVDPAADPQSRQFLVRAVVPNERNLIRPGMYCLMTIVTSATRHAVVVPHEAIQTGPKGPTVVVVGADMHAHVRPVRTGDEDQVGIALTDGVKAGELVVVLSPAPVKDGALVHIDKSAGPGQPAGAPTIVGGGGGASGPNSMQPTSGGPGAPNYGGGSSAGTFTSPYSTPPGATGSGGSSPTSTGTGLSGSNSAAQGSAGSASSGGSTMPSDANLRTPPPGSVTPQVNTRFNAPSPTTNATGATGPGASAGGAGAATSGAGAGASGAGAGAASGGTSRGGRG